MWIWRLLKLSNLYFSRMSPIAASSLLPLIKPPPENMHKMWKLLRGGNISTLTVHVCSAVGRMQNWEVTQRIKNVLKAFHHQESGREFSDNVFKEIWFLCTTFRNMYVAKGENYLEVFGFVLSCLFVSVYGHWFVYYMSFFNIHKISFKCLKWLRKRYLKRLLLFLKRWRHHQLKV